MMQRVQYLQFLVISCPSRGELSSLYLTLKLSFSLNWLRFFCLISTANYLDQVALPCRIRTFGPASEQSYARAWMLIYYSAQI